ncbi:uncharacterized protein LOC121367129, partial [Gigantopelta aegis]|uniref:uncharacterized protein LOC121367129 n=1 Tax=Gigantopelta aegis TaxID=1735272 RepID=UPI001B88AC6B
EEFQKVLSLHASMMHVALEEFDQYCDFNSWLCDIHIFCKKWSDKSVKEFKGSAAFTIEQKLTEIRQWSEKVRNFDRYFVSENGMFYIDCSIIHNVLLPKLDEIYQELITFVSEEGKTLAKLFVSDMQTVLQNLKKKHASVGAFAIYAKNYYQYKKNMPNYQQRIEYIKSLFEVIRMSYRQLSAEEEKLEESVWALWEAFMMQMQDAAEFVNTQTPVMTRQLEDTYQ